MRRLHRAFVVGMGEVGRRLAAALRADGAEVVEVTRTTGWDRAQSTEPGPRILAVREEVLPQVLDRLVATPPQDLVAVQNGWIRDMLPSNEVTRGLIWFTSKGDFFRCLRPSPFTGAWSDALVAALSAHGIPSSAVDAIAFNRLDADKMGFNCVVGLPLAVHGLSLAEYLDTMVAEARALFQESVAVCAATAGVAPPEQAWEHFLASAAPLGWVRVPRAKALELRNGAVVRLARTLGLEAPVNEDLLAGHEAAFRER